MGVDIGTGLLCYGCGTCTSSCPIARTNPIYDPRDILRRSILQRQMPFQDQTIWLCSMCFTCQERCPQGIPIADLISAARNLSCKYHEIPQAIRAQMDALKASGKTYPLDEFDMKKREKAGLPRLKEKIPDLALLLEEE